MVMASNELMIGCGRTMNVPSLPTAPREHPYSRMRRLLLLLLSDTSERIVDATTVDVRPARANRRLVDQLVPPIYAILKPGSDPTREPVCTGPFRLVDYVAHDHLTVVRNERYRGARARLDTVVFRFIPDETTRMLALRSLQVDAVVDVGRASASAPCFLAHLLFYSGPRQRPSGYARLFAPGPSLDRFVDACREAVTRDEVEQNAADAERVLVDEEFIVIPLAATRRVWGVSDRVRGFVPHSSSLSQRWERVTLR